MMKNQGIYIFPFLIFSLFLSLFLFAGCHKKKGEHVENIYTLDSLLLNSESFIIDRLKQVEEIKQKKRLAKTAADRYLFDNLLFENYYTLDADSALVYVNKSYQDALETGSREWITKSLINKASLLSATGLLKGALDIMEDINTSDMSRDELVDYYGQMVYLYSHLGNYTGGEENKYYITERLYKDSVMSVIKPNHPEYLWYKSWSILGTNENPDTVIQMLIKSLEESGKSERQDAKNAYALARLYHQKGDMENYERYMALSAIIDVKIANAEISSLEDLANLMFQDGNGDINRAYNYINYSLDKALNYPNRSRAFGMAKTIEHINKAYQENMQKQQHHTRVFLVLVCVLAGILIIAVVDIIFQNRRVKRQNKVVDSINGELNQKMKALSEADAKLNEMNHKLLELNEDLKKTNFQLYESNFVKEEYIGYIFKLWSNYIAVIEKFKRDIYLKAVKKQWKEIEASTAEIDMKEELKEFYQSFDTIFLNLYPGFVSDFNALLKPDKQIELRDGEVMNMELRIYALVRLGITDSVKIADFLHCAPQTVYNYRLRARSRSRYDREEFMTRIRTIGNFQGKLQ